MLPDGAAFQSAGGVDRDGECGWVAANYLWKYDDVRQVHGRRYELQDRALELFLVDNQAMIFFKINFFKNDFKRFLIDFKMIFN